MNHITANGPFVPGTQQACPCASGGSCPFHRGAGVAGAAVAQEEGKAIKTISTIVEGFLNELVDHITTRVADRIASQLNDLSAVPLDRLQMSIVDQAGFEALEAMRHAVESAVNTIPQVQMRRRMSEGAEYLKFYVENVHGKFEFEVDAEPFRDVFPVATRINGRPAYGMVRDLPTLLEAVQTIADGYQPCPCWMHGREDAIHTLGCPRSPTDQ